MATATEPLAKEPKTFNTVGDLPKIPKLDDISKNLSGAGGEAFKRTLGIYQPFSTAREDYTKLLSKSESDVAQSEQEQQRIKAQGTSDAAQKQVAAVQKAQQDLDEAMQKEPIPKFVPTKETAQDLAALFSVINVMGFLIGGSGKQNAQAAMSAMNGMLEGHQKGRADLYKQELSEFDKNFKAMVQKHADFRKKYEDAVKLAAVDKEAGISQAELVAIEYGSNVVKAKVKKGDILGGLETINSGEKLVKEANAALEKIEAEERKNAFEIEKEKRNRKFELDKQQLGFAHAEKLEKMREASAKELANLKSGGIGKIDREVYNIAAQNYSGIDPKDLTNLSKESVGRIVNSTRTLEEVEDIAKFIKQKPQAVGAAAKFQNIINYDAIKSVVGDSKTTSREKQRIIDSQIDDAVKAGKLTSDEASSAKLLNKKLFSLALADVQSSGQRGSVYLDKAFQNLYDQASRPETLVAILADRAHQSNRNLGNFGMQVENRKDASRFDLTTKGADQWITENFPVLTPAKVRERIAAGTLKNGDYFRTTDGRLVQANVPTQR